MPAGEPEVLELGEIEVPEARPWWGGRQRRVSRRELHRYVPQFGRVSD